MPLVETRILQGYSTAEKTRLTGALTQTVWPVVPARNDAIAAILQEYPFENCARGGQRYRSMTRSYGAIEAFRGDTAAVVYTRGILQGEWPDGTPFEDIRFSDRFERVDGEITHREVWDDIAEVRPR